MLRTICFTVTLAFLVQGCADADSPDKTGNGNAASENSNSGSKVAGDKTTPGPNKNQRPTVALPGNKPDDIPIYPDSRCTAAGTSDGGIRQPPNTLIHLETTDDIKAVREYYSKEPEKLEWKMEQDIPGENAFLWKKGQRKLSIQFHVLQTDPPVVDISLFYTRPEDGGSTQP